MNETSGCTIEEQQLISRLIVEKFLSSSSSCHLSDSSYKKLTKILLSDDPREQFTICYVVDDTRKNSYFSNGIEVQVFWTDASSTDETIDASGSVWVKKKLIMNISTPAAYGLKFDEFQERITRYNLVYTTLQEIQSLVPDSLNIKILDNTGRLKREEERRVNSINKKIVERLVGKNRMVRHGLRVRGKPRILSSNDEFIQGLPAGEYSVKIDDGTNRVSRMKSYTIKINSVGDSIVQRTS